jgi:hypothetical protein
MKRSPRRNPGAFLFHRCSPPARNGRPSRVLTLVPHEGRHHRRDQRRDEGPRTEGDVLPPAANVLLREVQLDRFTRGRLLRQGEEALRLE